MGFQHGKATVVLFDDHDLSGFLNDSTVSDESEANDTTTYGLGAKRYIPGLEDVTVNLAGLFDGDADATEDVFSTALKGGVAVHALVVSDAPSVVGKRVTFLEAVKTKYEVNSPVADVVTVAVDLQGSKGAAHGLMLANVTDLAADATEASVDGGDWSAGRVRAQVHVLANDRDGATTISIDHSSDDVSFVQVGTIEVPAGETGVFTLDVEVAALRYLQADLTLAGTSGAITLAAAAARL